MNTSFVAASVRAIATAGICLATGLGLSGGVSPASAADWSATEIQYENGILKVPKFATGGAATSVNTPIITLQHASGWGFGDVFFFVDFLFAEDGQRYNFNNRDAYGEFYAYFSSAKVLKLDFGKGVIKDVGAVAGVNYGANPGVLKILPGGYIDWNVPGFPYLRTQFTAYIDASAGISAGSSLATAPSETNSWQFDVSWAYPIELVGQRFSFEGHVEYTAGRKNQFGGEVSDWVLGQPQFRWDVGYAVTGRKDQFFIGTEYQFWFNKLGEKGTNESAFQGLAVWRF